MMKLYIQVLKTANYFITLCTNPYEKKNKYLLRSFGDQFNEIIKFGNGVSLFTKNNRYLITQLLGKQELQFLDGIIN